MKGLNPNRKKTLCLCASVASLSQFLRKSCLVFGHVADLRRHAQVLK